MADFSDVIEFAQTHRPCGGVTPAISLETSGGYRLTLTCGCGATFERRVTADEAAQAPFARLEAAEAVTEPPTRGIPRTSGVQAKSRALRLVLAALLVLAAVGVLFYVATQLDLGRPQAQNSPVTFPTASTSMPSAPGTFGSPGIVSTSPA